jgi:hypothetical protein
MPAGKIFAAELSHCLFYPKAVNFSTGRKKPQTRRSEEKWLNAPPRAVEYEP